MNGLKRSAGTQKFLVSMTKLIRGPSSSKLLTSHIVVVTGFYTTQYIFSHAGMCVEAYTHKNAKQAKMQ